MYVCYQGHLKIINNNDRYNVSMIHQYILRDDSSISKTFFHTPVHNSKQLLFCSGV